MMFYSEEDDIFGRGLSMSGSHNLGTMADGS